MMAFMLHGWSERYGYYGAFIHTNYSKLMYSMVPECTQLGKERSLHQSTDRPWFSLLATNTVASCMHKVDNSEVRVQHTLHACPGRVGFLHPPTVPSMTSYKTHE